jgi:hypothetical protein
MWHLRFGSLNRWVGEMPTVHDLLTRVKTHHIGKGKGSHRVPCPQLHPIGSRDWGGKKGRREGGRVCVRGKRFVLFVVGASFSLKYCENPKPYTRTCTNSLATLHSRDCAVGFYA